MRSIGSVHNPLIKEIRNAAARGAETGSGLVIAEGPHLLEEAARSTWSVEHVVVTPAAAERFSGIIGPLTERAIEVSEPLFARINTTGTSQGVLSLLRPRKWMPEELHTSSALWVVLDGVQDPGNAGTMVRSAEAFGATAVLFYAGCVRISNPKFLRATAGSIFRLPYLESPAAEQCWTSPKAETVPVFALDQKAPMTLEGADFRAGCAIAVGNEGGGLSADLRRKAKLLRISAERVESLNAAVACSIALYVAAKQRGK